MTSKPLNSSANLLAIFFILATVASVVAAVLIGPILAVPDYLTAMSENANTVVLAAVFMLVAVVAIIGFSATLFPILRQHSEVLAVWLLIKGFNQPHP